MIVGIPSMPSSERMDSTTLTCSGALRWVTSMTCSTAADSDISSSVARNAATSVVGSLWMKPTVSVSSAGLPDGSMMRRVTGSSVENMRFSARTPARVIRLSSVLLPAFVYPTSDTTGRSFAVRFDLCSRLCRRTPSKSAFRFCSRLRTSRLSVSICVSPGPLMPIPPAIRSKCVHCPARRGKRYSVCANSTCRRPSRVRALDANTSKISAVRSSAFRPPSASSRLRCCVGVSSSSQITVSASSRSHISASSRSLPLPR